MGIDRGGHFLRLHDGRTVVGLVNSTARLDMVVHDVAWLDCMLIDYQAGRFLDSRSPDCRLRPNEALASECPAADSAWTVARLSRAVDLQSKPVFGWFCMVALLTVGTRIILQCLVMAVPVRDLQFHRLDRMARNRIHFCSVAKPQT